MTNAGRQRPPIPNPNPRNYSVNRWEQHGPLLLIEVKYLDCTNYEGNKIMVYIGDIVGLTAQRHIDPHFSENRDFMSPIARFEPTAAGWRMGEAFCRLWEVSS